MRVQFGGLIHLKIECCIVRGSFCVQSMLSCADIANVFQRWGGSVSQRFLTNVSASDYICLDY